MSRTYKDRFYCGYCDYDWEKQNNWGVGESGCRAFLKKYTNRKLRRYSKGVHRGFRSRHCDGDIADGGAYKKMFITVWDVW